MDCPSWQLLVAAADIVGASVLGHGWDGSYAGARVKHCCSHTCHMPPMAMWRWACVAAAETYPPTPAYQPFHSHQPTQCLGIFSFEGRSPAGRQSRSEMCEASGFYMKSVWRHLEEFLDFPFYTCYIYPSSLIVNFDKMKCFQILLWIAIYYLPLDRFRWLVFRFIIFHVTVAVNINFNFIYKTIDIYHPFEPNHLNIKRFLAFEWKLFRNELFLAHGAGSVPMK